MQNSATIRLVALTAFIASAFACAVAFSAEESKPAKPAETPKVETPQMIQGFTMKHNLDESGKPSTGKFIDAPAWAVSEFRGKGNVRVDNGVVYIEKGNDMTGIRWTGPLAKRNYEISLEAMRVDGRDFFCGLTFPVGDDPCSFIVGGWGGTVVGLSSLDYQDASNNETCRTRSFENNQWYKIRVVVTDKHIQAWIDDTRMVNVRTEGRKIGIRWEVENSRPLGIATWCTTGAIRNIIFNASSTPLPEPEDDSEPWK